MKVDAILVATVGGDRSVLVGVALSISSSNRSNTCNRSSSSSKSNRSNTDRIRSKNINSSTNTSNIQLLPVQLKPFSLACLFYLSTIKRQQFTLYTALRGNACNKEKKLISW